MNVCKAIGAAPTGTKDDGSPYYTLPVIHDRVTNTTVPNSLDIALYLDKTFPETSILIPTGTIAFHAAFDIAFMTTACGPLSCLMQPVTCDLLNSASAVFYRNTREQDWSPSAAKCKDLWNQARAGFTRVAGWMSKGGDGKFIMGETICYADIIVASWLVWIKVILGAESKEWKGIQEWDGGKWQRMMKSLEIYETVAIV